MPWARLGDNSATYPKLMQIAGYPGADDRAINETRGWLLACATQSAGHLTDYVVDPGTAQMFGGARTKTLIRWCVRAGLLNPIKLDGVQQWVIIDDPEFIHIRTRAEVEWDRQRNRDVSDTGLTVQVRRRDGDNCRYCGVLVQWRGKKSNRSAEYDHRIPGQAATVDTLVVACRRCNGARQASERWDDDHPIRPAPTRPNYSTWSAQFLTENGYPTDPNVEPGTTRVSSADTAAVGATRSATSDNGNRRTPAGDAAVGANLPDPGAVQATTTGEDDGPPEVTPEVPPKSHSSSPVTGSPGSGRDGTQGGRGPAPPGRPRRGTRGRRRPAHDQAPEPTTSTATTEREREIPMAPPNCCAVPHLITDEEESGALLCLTCGAEAWS